MSNRFHLALPAGNLDVAKEFYCGLLGCEQGNEEINDQDSWVDVNFWGNELTLHETDSTERLLSIKHHVDYGDVDVLAWSLEERIVLVCECKSLLFAKTYKEIGNQMCEFLGKVNSRGKPDQLMKHFQRMEVISNNLVKLNRAIKVDGEFQLCAALIFSSANIAEVAPQVPREKLYVCNEENLNRPSEMKSKIRVWRNS